MGIGKAFTAAVGGTLSDQWLEAFSCDALAADTLAQRGRKMQSDRSANTKGSDDVISVGSLILVPDGAAAIVTEMGEVIDCFQTPGEHKFSGRHSESVFSGKLSGALRDVGRRISFGGDAAVVQRVLYINTKEIPGNECSIPPVTVRLHDGNTTLDLDASVEAHGVFSMRITDPVRFYQNVCGGISGSYATASLLPQLQGEIRHAFAPVLAALCEDGVRPFALAEMTEQIAEKVREAVCGKWCALRGIELFSFALDSLTVTPASMETVQQAQRAKMLTDPAMAGATLTAAMADALPAAAANGAGAMAGLFLASSAGPQLWHCKCGQYNTGRFCENCGRENTNNN